jgi:hypothetical protein
LRSATRTTTSLRDLQPGTRGAVADNGSIQVARLVLTVLAIFALTPAY